jgi:hypothetical protein
MCWAILASVAMPAATWPDTTQRALPQSATRASIRILLRRTLRPEEAVRKCRSRLELLGPDRAFGTWSEVQRLQGTEVGYRNYGS